MKTPEDRINRFEETLLAPYASFSSQTRGRQYPIEEHPLRTAYQRDRDRVIHCAAFRRMEYKTQVFVNHEGDHYRTRLTHTIEVAQISRTIARALGLNEDLSEAIACVHDLGHTPFGHSGEDVLDELMREFGGFNHNRQSLRVVDVLERRYENYPGLNLTYEVREGIVKHESTASPISPDIFPPDEQPTLEASLVDLADSIAYNSHDVDDGLSSGILGWDDLDEVPVLAEAKEISLKANPDLDRKYHQRSVIRQLVDRQVTDLVHQTMKNIGNFDIGRLEDVRRCKVRLISFSTDLKNRLIELKAFLTRKMYRHPRMKKNAAEAGIILETLFNIYKADPQKLHGKYKLRVGREPVEYIICDFIAGMTDRYAQKMYDELKR
ncbi:MAG TPA: deoxyguanosinetriphosphate triphosphohydrolase [candidate division Zixibacteria bacterium]|nr:deoxyguanosinetriphosphate triphosphohydrolase [candidate division Zixibacteria bacterium]